MYEEKTQDEKTAAEGEEGGEGGEGQRLQLFERELSVTQHDIFYRELKNDESPLELFMLWKINQERKTLLLTDHDPNIRKYKKCSDEDLERRLLSLNSEEDEHVAQIEHNYANAKKLIEKLLLEKDPDLMCRENP